MAKDYTKAIITDGSMVKGIDLPQYPDSAWHWYSGEPDGTEDDQHAKDYYSRVAAVYRAANINANVISSIPFAIVNKNGDEVDSSADWKNKVGFMPNPRDLLRLWRLSLFMTNRAYGFREGPENFKIISNVRYLVPTSVEPIVNSRDGLVGFTRTIGGAPMRYPVQDDGWCRIVYMHWLDHTTEVLPSKHTEFKALMNAAGVLYHADEHVKNFFARGGIKPTMLLVKGIASKDAQEKIESIWTKVITGTYKWLGKVFQGEAVEPHVIGDGIDNLKDSNLHKQALEDIAMAAGMPLSLLLSNSANYATASQEYAAWFQNEVEPRAHWMAERLNDQIFDPLGLRFEFRPEVTNEGTEEEEQRAGAYSALVASLVKPSAAAQMLGFELPPDYAEFTQLDDDYFEMLRLKSEIQSRAIQNAQSSLAPKEPTIAGPKPPRDKVNPDVAKPEKATGQPLRAFTVAEYTEAKNWHDIAQRKRKRGEVLQFPFTAKELDEGIATAIRQRLPECKTEQDIEDCFDLNNYIEGAGDADPGLKEVAKALNRAADALLLSETKPSPAEYDNKEDFMSACVPKVLDEGTAEDNDQAVAICSSMWDKKGEGGDT